MRILILTIALLAGCEALENSADNVLTRGPDGEPSQAERVVDSTGWLLGPPYDALLAGIVGALSGFWTSRKMQKKS